MTKLKTINEIAEKFQEEAKNYLHEDSRGDKAIYEEHIADLSFIVRDMLESHEQAVRVDVFEKEKKAYNEGFDDGEKFGRAECLNDQKKRKPRFID